MAMAGSLSAFLLFQPLLRRICLSFLLPTLPFGRFAFVTSNMSCTSDSDMLTVVGSSPESSPAPETPTKQPVDRDDEDQLFRHFRGWAWSQRSRDTLSWVWQFGFDIEKETERRWVCKACVRKKVPKPGNVLAIGTQNAERHLWDHHQIQDPSGRRTAPSSRKKPLKSYRTITQAWNLDLTKPRDQAIANSFIKKFDRLASSCQHDTFNLTPLT